jgi:hypothetical protein
MVLCTRTIGCKDASHFKGFKRVNAKKLSKFYRRIFPFLAVLTFVGCAEDGPTIILSPIVIETNTAVETPSPTTTPTASLTSTATFPAGDIILVGAGDISSCENDNDELTARLLDEIPGIVFTTGDNVYPTGTYDRFLDCYGPTWGRHKDRTKPVPGDHDYANSDGSGYFDYFSEIDLYYAYDLGSWRIYALNTLMDVSPRSEQVTWLRDDLAAHPRQCVLAYWHSPRWSSGKQHGSEEIAQTLWQMFYAAGAELVLNGDEHHYERFAEMDAEGKVSAPGLREFVVGTGGRSLYGFGNIHPASQVRNESTYGVLKLTLHVDSYEWEFVPAEGYSFTDSGITDCH